MLKPLGPRVLIRPDNPITTTKGGLVLPDKAQKTVTRGEIVEVGEAEEGFAPLQLEEGDRVVYSQYAGHEISEKDEILILMHVKDVLAIEVD